MHCDIMPPHKGSGCYQHSQDGLPYVLGGWAATQLKCCYHRQLLQTSMHIRLTCHSVSETFITILMFR